MKHILALTYTFLLAFSFSSCHKETNPLDNLVDIVGDVAQVSSVTSPDNVTAGSTIDLVIRCNALNTTIKEFKFYQRIGTSGSYTLVKTEPFVPNFSTAERLHVITLPYVVPNESGKTLVYK